MRKLKEQTCTSKVMEALQARDDFMTKRHIAEATGLDNHRTTSCLHHLRKYKAVDFMVEDNGTSWWYVLPQECDTRLAVHEERTPESKPRKRRIKKGGV